MEGKKSSKREAGPRAGHWALTRQRTSAPSLTSSGVSSLSQRSPQNETSEGEHLLVAPGEPGGPETQNPPDQLITSISLPARGSGVWTVCLRSEAVCLSEPEPASWAQQLKPELDTPALLPGRTWLHFHSETESNSWCPASRSVSSSATQRGRQG